MKYFLTCEHCGHKNEVTSEYLTFCESCAKKLALNYRDWQKKHLNATLTEYMEKVCVNEVVVARETREEKALVKDGWSHWIGISQTLAVIIGLGLFILPIYLNITDLKYTLEASTYSTHSLDYAWKESTLGSFGLHINSPLPLEQTELPLPENAMSAIDMMESFVGGSESGPLGIMANSVKYKPGIELSLEGAAIGTVNAIKSIPGISDFNYRQEAIEISGVDGYEQFGSYNQNNRSLRFINVIALKDLVFWQILFTYDPSLNGMQDLVIKSVQSIDIQYNTSI